MGSCGWGSMSARAPITPRRWTATGGWCGRGGWPTTSAAELCWAVDSTGGSASLLLALLAAADQPVVYVPGRVVNRMAGAFAGEAKTDATDALVIAQTARMRQDLQAARPRSELVAELAVLVGH